MSLQNERTQVIFSGLEFHPCDTRLYRTLQTRPEKHVTEASPTVACQRAHAKRTTVTRCVMLPRHERSKAVERLERLERTDPHLELSVAIERLERLELTAV
jgi:hypothetical protein